MRSPTMTLLSGFKLKLSKWELDEISNYVIDNDVNSLLDEKVEEKWLRFSDNERIATDSYHQGCQGRPTSYQNSEKQDD